MGRNRKTRAKIEESGIKIIITLSLLMWGEDQTGGDRGPHDM